jgi:hypothetical protein
MENPRIIAILMHFAQLLDNHEKRIHRNSIQCMALEEVVLRFVPVELQSQYKSKIDALTLSTAEGSALLSRQIADDLQVLRKSLES